VIKYHEQSDEARSPFGELPYVADGFYWENPSRSHFLFSARVSALFKIPLLKKERDMKCHTCEQAPKNGTMHYAVNEAVGVCQNCGVGICVKHSHKEDKPGSPLLCLSCAKLRSVKGQVK